MSVAASVPSAHTLDQLSDGLRGSALPAAVAVADHLATIFGETTLAVLHYGSRAQRRARRSDSAYDFFVVVTRYDAAYRAAATVLGASCRPRLAVALARLLPPNALSVRSPAPDGEQEAKCLIISLDDFRRECSARARDHFVQARLIQTVQLAWAREPGGAEPVLDSIHHARDRTFEWARVFLPPLFDLPTYCRTLIAVSFHYELRAEPRGHPEVLYAAQRDLLHAIYRPVLERRAAAGILHAEGDAWRQRPGGWLRRWLIRSHFAWSGIRTTARLLKHPFLYDDWLGYLLRKIDRSTGQKIALTPREQRHPLIFLWPRAFRYLRSRPHRRPG
jgi:hypothetical protein